MLCQTPVSVDTDDTYIQALRDSFNRYLAATMRPLLAQNRDLKAALNAERKRAAQLAADLERHA